jgi:hypothetical protein
MPEKLQQKSDSGADPILDISMHIKLAVCIA